MRDYGQVYANQVNGYAYGWDADNTANGRNRDVSADQRYDTFVQMQAGGANRSWAIAVPNDTYKVHIVAGDPLYYDSVYKIAAEGVTVVNGTPTSSSKWVEGTVDVTVTDGKLTITNATGSSNNKICYIDIVDSGRLSSVPAAPSGLTALPENTTTVNLNWADNADNDTAVVVERSLNGTSGWTGYTQPRDATHFADVSGLAASTAYYYRVKATNPAGSSAYSSVVNLTTPANNNQAPYNATRSPWSVGSVIEAENYDSGGDGIAYDDADTTNTGGLYRKGFVDIANYYKFPQNGYFLGWNEAGEWAEYTVNVPSAGTYAFAASVAKANGIGGTFHMSVGGADKTGAMTVPDTGGWTTYQTVSKSGISLTAGQHVMRVTIDALGPGGGSFGNVNWFKLISTAGPTLPAAPSNLNATAASSTQINLTWSDNSGNETGFEIDRSTSSTFATGMTMITVGANVTSHVATGLTANTTYYFRVRATNAGGDSVNSAADNATTSAGTTPAAPTGLAAAVASVTQVNLDWVDSAGSGTTYNVYRGTTASFTVSTASRIGAGIAVSRYVDAGVPSAGTYYYKVTATGGGIESSATTTAAQNTAVTPPAPAAMSNLTAVWDPSANGGQGAAVLTWTDNSLGESRFVLTRTGGDGSTHTLTAPTNATTLSDAGPLPTGSTYVGQSQNAGGSSSATPPTGPVGPRTPGADDGTAPVISSITTGTSGAVTTASITWDEFNPATTSYRIYQLMTLPDIEDYRWSVVANIPYVPIHPHTFTLPGAPLDGNHIYSFMVRAIYEDGGGRESTPFRVYTGPAAEDKAQALGWLVSYEAMISQFPYYTALMNANEDHPSVQGIFDQTSFAMDYAKVVIDSGAQHPGGYDRGDNEITFNPNLMAGQKGITVIHESMHVLDYLYTWTGAILFSTNSQEAVVYSVENMLVELDNGTKSLNKFTTTTFANAAAAQSHWNQAWVGINRVIGSNFIYENFGTQSGNLTFDQVNTTLLTNAKCTFSASVLLSRYNKILEQKGFAPNTLTNVLCLNPLDVRRKFGSAIRSQRVHPEE